MNYWLQRWLGFERFNFEVSLHEKYLRSPHLQKLATLHLWVVQKLETAEAICQNLKQQMFQHACGLWVQSGRLTLTAIRIGIKTALCTHHLLLRVIWKWKRGAKNYFDWNYNSILFSNPSLLLSKALFKIPSSPTHSWHITWFPVQRAWLHNSSQINLDFIIVSPKMGKKKFPVSKTIPWIRKL